MLHAGVVHRLREQAQPDPGEDEDEPRTAVVILDDWTGDPLATLTARIQALSGDGAVAGADGAQSPIEAVIAYRARHHGGLLLILDQFEEYLRLHPDPRTQGFDELLAELVRDPRLSVRILIAIREDRLADLDRFGRRIPQLLGNVLRLGPLTPAAALEAIEGPVDRYDEWVRDGRGGREVTLEPGLAQAVRDELVALSGRRRADPSVGDGAGPEAFAETTFLQLVMRRLWDVDIVAGGGARVRLATLAELGGADEIVATHLDTALARLSEDEQSLLAEMLRYLVTPSGATACLTARDLSEYTERPQAEVEALAEKLGRPPARILRGVAAPAGETGASGYELPQVLAEPALEWRTRRRTARLEERSRRLLLALVAMTAIAVALVGYAVDPQVLEPLKLATVDARFDLRGARPDSRIALVTLDDAAHERLMRGPRPPRATIARALDALAAARPRAVAVDIIFNGRRDSASDRALIKAITGPLRGRLVLATDRLNEQGESQLFGRESMILDGSTAPAVGYAGFLADPGDVARRIDRRVAIERDGKPLPHSKPLDTLAVATARVGGGVPPEQLPKTAWIDYRGKDGTYPRVAFYDVLDRKPEALAKLRGKIVVLGNMATAVGDVHGTSAPGPNSMHGPEIQANAISTALDRFPLRDGGRMLDLALIVVLGLLPLAIALRLSAALVAPAAILAGVLFCAAAQLAFGGGRVVSVVYPLSSLGLATIGLTLGPWLGGAMRRSHRPARAARGPSAGRALSRGRRDRSRPPATRSR